MYTCKIDEINLDQWHRYNSFFPEMNIYQSGLYGDLHSKSFNRSCSRVAILDGKEVKALAQLRIKKIPFTQKGVAEIDWGPLWQHEDNWENSLGKLLDELVKEYCVKRRLELRIRPRSTLTADGDVKLDEIFERHGFRKNTNIRPYHTVVIDLQKPLETIRAEFHQKWRNQLNVANRADLSYEIGSSIEYFDRFYSIYEEMWKIKKFPTGVRVPIIRELHKRFPNREKFIVTVVYDDKDDIGATVCSAMGNTMLYFLGATSPNKRKDSRAGYFLQWLHIEKAKELGIRWYDLGGYDDDNPTIARFKKRTNGMAIVYPFQYEAYANQSPQKTYLFLENAFRKTRKMISSK